MPRRMIDPAFWQSQTVAALPIPTRYFFVGLFSNADDQGRLRGHPALLRSLIYPYDDIPLKDIGAMLLDLAGDGGPILLYEVDGKTLIQIRNWWKWQHLTWAWPSDLPSPPGWVDRLCYRRGNAVVKSHWDSDEPESAPPAPESGPRVAPEWPQSEPTVRPAPSGSISGSGSGSSNEKSSDELSGAHAPRLAAPSSFAEWLDLVQSAKKRELPLIQMHQVLFPGRDPPAPGYVNTVAKAVGGAGRLAELFWQCSSRPPTGDVLAYCRGIAKGNKRDNGSDTLADDHHKFVAAVEQGGYGDYVYNK